MISDHIRFSDLRLSYKTMNFPKHLLPACLRTNLHCADDHNEEDDSEKWLFPCLRRIHFKFELYKKQVCTSLEISSF